MPKAGYLGVKVDPDLLEQINKAAKEDYRKQGDQIRYLLDLGLQERNRREQSIENTQVNMPQTAEEREAALERLR
jgi:hypothetical protein